MYRKSVGVLDRGLKISFATIPLKRSFELPGLHGHHEGVERQVDSCQVLEQIAVRICCANAQPRKSTTRRSV